MKKTFIVGSLAVLLLFLVAPVISQQVVPTNQITVSWNQSVSDGMLPGTYSYQVYTMQYGLDKAVEENWVLQGETTGLTQTVSFTVEGKYLVGVRTKRVLEDSSVLYSDMNWSDVNGESTPNPFIIFFGTKPDAPLNLKYQ